MGRHLLRRTDLAFLIAFAVLVSSLGAEEKPRETHATVVSEGPRGSAASLPVESLEESEAPPEDLSARPWFPKGRRNVIRPALAAMNVEYRSILREPRQFHGGPEVFSPEFAVNDQVQWYLDRFAQHPEETLWVLGALKRAAPFAHFVRSKIEEYGLPPEIYYLPVVESLYLVNAHSPAGALGLWQFTRDSAWPWMKINDWVDERKDFWKSTEAAMEKLKLNYRYTGDWLLSLAAYNCGLTWVMNAIQKSGSRDFWTLARQGYLPKETRNYIPKFIAVVRYSAHQGRMGRDLGWEEPATWERIPLNQAVDLRLLSQAAGVSYDSLKAGNAELTYGITPPTNMDYRLKVPTPTAEKVKKALNDSEIKLLKFAIHTVGEGDTLYDLSLHFGIPISMIQKYNPQVRPETLRIGLKLVVPLFKDVGPYLRKKSVIVEDDGPPYFPNEYAVRDGDTLWDIARSFGTTSARLARGNAMSENGILRPGMTLKVP